MQQPLVTHLSRSRRGLAPDGHLQWAAEVEQLLHTLLGIGWSPSTLASFVARGYHGLTKTAAGVQLRLNFLQQEGGLTAEEAAKTFSRGCGHILGDAKISTLHRGLEQLRATGLSAERVRKVLRRNCQLLCKSPLDFQKKLDCLQGVKIFCSARYSVRCNPVCLLPWLTSICCTFCIVYIADLAQRCVRWICLSGAGQGYSEGEIHEVVTNCPEAVTFSTKNIEGKHAAWGRQLGVTGGSGI